MTRVYRYEVDVGNGRVQAILEKRLNGFVDASAADVHVDRLQACTLNACAFQQKIQYNFNGLIIHR